MSKEYSELEIKVKSKFDDIVFNLFKDEKKQAFSEVEETDTGFIYKVDFRK